MADNEGAFLSEGERAFFNALNDLGVRYIIVGMSAALLQGARGATEDIDIWFESLSDDRIGQAAQRAGSFWVTRMTPPMLGGALGDRFDVVTHMSGLSDFAHEYADTLSENIDGVELKILKLRRIIHSKRTANRDKDRAVLHALDAALSVIEALKKP